MLIAHVTTTATAYYYCYVSPNIPVIIKPPPDLVVSVPNTGDGGRISVEDMCMIVINEINNVIKNIGDMGFEVGKDNKDKSEQNQSKPTKKRKRQDKSEEWKPILKAGSARYNKKRVNEEPIEEKGLIVTSLQSLMAHLDVLKVKGLKLLKMERWFIMRKRGE
ncbi:hypothetical protein Tco_0973260 [Tanacetum coccineum]